MRKDEARGRWPFGGLTPGARIDRDSLGDLFRAVAPAGSAEQRLLLRRLDRRLLDTPAFRSALDPPVPSTADSPRQRLETTWVVDVDGAPCLAHRERPGVTLYRMLAAARRHGESLGERPALAIARDLTRALIELEALRPGDTVAHGFLLPQLVWVTDDGSAHLVGVEAARALRSGLAAAVRERSLGPDAAAVRANGEARPEDDVYSLACLLLAMLTGREPPAEPAAAPAVIAAGKVGELEDPLPPELVRLLERTLVADPSGPPDLQRWRNELDAALVAFERPPTAFDVALFLRNHHRDDLAAFGDHPETPKSGAGAGKAAFPEPERASSSDDTAAAGGRPTAPAVPEPQGGAGAETENARTARSSEPDDPGRRPSGHIRRLLPVAAALGVALLIAGLLLTRGGSGGSMTAPPAPEDAAAPTPAPLPPVRPPAPIAPAEDAEPAPEATGSDPADASRLDPQNLEQLVDEALGEREDDLRQAYETQVGELERRLDELERTPETVAPESTASPPADSPTARRGPDRAPLAGPERPLPAATAPEPRGSAAGPPARSEPPTRRTRSEPPAPSSEDEATTSANVRPAASIDSAAANRRQPPPAPKTLPPELLHPPKLTYPRRARRLNREAEVTVRVLVDIRGRVVDAELEPGQELGYGFEEVALEAVRTASYRAATRAGEPVEAWTTIKLVYRLE